MKLFYCVMLLLCPFSSEANQNPSLVKLKVGDKVPDIWFKNIVNYSRTESNLSHFKKKAILLDFWTTTCGSCTQKFSLLDSMQKAYPDDLSILLISATPSDSKEKVSKLFKRLADKNVTVNLPIILGDTMMKHFFPLSYVPHYAWLDSNLTLIAFTGFEETTAQNLETFAKGLPVRFAAAEYVSDFKFDKPLFIEGNGGNGNGLLTRSTLNKYIYGLPTGNYITKDSNNKVVQVMMTNQPLVCLIQRAYNFFRIKTRIHFPPTGSESLQTEGQPLDQVIANSYTYELLTPPVTIELALTWMQSDIKRYFGYTAEVKKVKTRCYILTLDSCIIKQFSGTKNDSVPPYFIEDFAEMLDLRLPFPVVNESSYNGAVAIPMPANNIKTISSLRAALAPYGIKLTEGERFLDSFFIYHHPPN